MFPIKMKRRVSTLDLVWYSEPLLNFLSSLGQHGFSQSPFSCTLLVFDLVSYNLNFSNQNLILYSPQVQVSFHKTEVNALSLLKKFSG